MSVFATTINWGISGYPLSSGSGNPPTYYNYNTLCNIDNALKTKLNFYGEAPGGTSPTVLGGHALELNIAGGGDQTTLMTYAFADSLQSSVPVYFAITYKGNLPYGTGNWFIISAGFSPSCTDTQQFICYPNGGNGPNDAGGYNQSWNENCYISVDTNRACLMIGEGPDIYANVLLNIERTKDASGNDTSEGFIFQLTQPTTSVYDITGSSGAPYPRIVNRVLPFKAGSLYTSSGLPAGLPDTMAGANSHFITAVNEASTTLTSGSTTSVMDITPFNFRPYRPGLGLKLYLPADATADSPISVACYDGNSHTYMPMNHGGYMNYTNPTSTACLLMRYE